MLPHSGHCPAQFLATPKSLEASMSLASVYFSSTLAIASAQERTARPSSQATDGHRMPRRCLATEARSMPDLKAKEISRQVASSCAEAQPPDLPRLEKTSQIPLSSKFTVTYMSPQPVVTRSVV